MSDSKRFFHKVNDPFDLEIITPEEIKEFPDFFYFPDDRRIGVSKDGRVLNIKSGKLIKGSFHVKKQVIYFHITEGSNKRNVYQHHRIIARTFIGRPSRHFNKLFSKLDVNHIDGDRKNNSIENLEWVTNKENQIHAHKAGLNSKDKRVLARNLKTDGIAIFVSTKECAEFFDINRKTFWKHLNSGLSGKYQKNGHIFKFEDDQPWNIYPRNLIQELGFSKKGKPIMVVDMRTQVDNYFFNIDDISKFTNISRNKLYKCLGKGSIVRESHFHIQRLDHLNQ